MVMTDDIPLTHLMTLTLLSLYSNSAMSVNLMLMTFL